jgi:hypothetical protein
MMWCFHHVQKLHNVWMLSHFFHDFYFSRQALLTLLVQIFSVNRLDCHFRL